jgi:hypothetical protein
VFLKKPSTRAISLDSCSLITVQLVDKLVDPLLALQPLPMDVDGQSNGLKEPLNSSSSTNKPGNSSSGPLATTKTRAYRPYFTHEEVTSMSIKQRTGGSEETQEKARQLACSFIEAVGNRMGLYVRFLKTAHPLIHLYSPRKTIGTAQTLYHRFRLFFPVKDFNPHVWSLKTRGDLI